MSAFDALDRATWPEILTAEEVAPLYRKTSGAVKRACINRVFVPAPFASHPWRWRRVDVIRHLDAPTMPVRIRRAS